MSVPGRGYALMARDRKRKCRCCKEFFTPDCRNRGRQRYCAKRDCRRASKRAAQQKWRRGKGVDYFKGDIQVDRVRKWRALNPDYAPRETSTSSKPLQDSLIPQTLSQQSLKPSYPQKPLQDPLFPQTLMLLGLIHHLMGDCESSLQDHIQQFMGTLISRGQRLHEQGVSVSTLLGGSLDERQTNTLSGSSEAGASPI